MKFKDLIYYLGWAAGLFGAILMLCGVIGFFMGGNFLMVRNFFNWFFIANSFLFLGIFLLVASHILSCCHSHEKEG